MVVIELIDVKTGQTQVIKIQPPATVEEISKKMQELVQGTSSGWVLIEENKVLIVPKNVVNKSIITIREEKEDAISSEHKCDLQQ